MRNGSVTSKTVESTPHRKRAKSRVVATHSKHASIACLRDSKTPPCPGRDSLPESGSPRSASNHGRNKLKRKLGIGNGVTAKIQARGRLLAFLWTLLAGSVVACASGGGSATATPQLASLTFEQALLVDSSAYEPPTAFRAVAESDWAQAAMTGSVGGVVVEGSKWKLGDSCEVHFTTESDVLAASESAPLPTRKLGADACRGHTGFWQMSAGRVFFWMPLAGNWSAEYYGDFADDSTMLLRRYPLRRSGPRTWKPDRDAAVTARATRIMEIRVVKSTYPVTNALKAVGETDWATRPGFGTAASVAGTRWKTQ